VTTQAITRGVMPLVWVCEGVSRLVAGRTRQPGMTREEFASLAEIGPREGALRDEESRIIRNLLGLRGVRVQDIMTPRSVVFMVRAEKTVEEVAGPEFELPFARMPVFGEGPDDLLGLVHRYEVLRAHRAGGDGKTMRELMRPLHIVPETASVADVMQQMMDRQEQMFSVVDEYGGTAGIVTMEDAIETLLGAEIVDETDSVEDMRELARRRHDQRMRRIAERERRSG
jgi:CBS domain containing-hemolysin-like protein